ncbi:right-handed parallel beta-helix repeat-containing protein [Novosphingobium decolorationis]|uniref:Right-handed parallel beta-helix repeat-containing protein n=1 Tax=Novosphingobium decolorationis TaxID=2698673 RepID=A0ABX8EAU6_9SPHN|nr:right-handed parallel beta-helix repeat-containing protein [Novosphingobium decolorationis]
MRRCSTSRGTPSTRAAKASTSRGAGATDLIAQNGIVLVSDADATLSGNTISGFAYSPGTWSAAGILAYDAGVVDITGNTLTAPSTSGSLGIYLYDTEASAITGNSLTGTGQALTQAGAFETAHSEDTAAPNSFAGNLRNLDIAPDVSPTSYRVHGSPGDDVLVGSDGEDVLSGNGGDDRLVGGNGGDDLSGGAGNDTLEGGGGSDLLDGGDGDDTIQAGGGRDIIRFSAGLDTVNGGAGQDTLLLTGTAADYAILVLGLDHFRITRHADGAVTEATSIETLGFVPAEPLVANDDIFAVTAGDLHVLDVLGNDMGTGMIIGAGLTAGDVTLSVTGAGDALELDLTAAYAYLDAGETGAVNIAYLLSDGASSSDVGFVTVTILGVADPVGAVGDIDGAINAVAEGLAAGAATGITARAIDPDTTNWVNYSLLDDADGAFVIDAASGVVTTALTLDREGAGGASRAITVAATSSDGTSSQANFTIAVTDTSDAAISAVSDTDMAPDRVLEGAAAGTRAGLTAFASDPDLAETVTYSLDDDAGGAFTIASDSGVISVADGTLIDRESAASLDVTVRATSSDGSHEVRTFAIAIADDDEFDVSAPLDTLGAPGGLVTENAGLGTAPGIHVSAQDADATTNGVSYSLLDDDGGRFLVSATSGEVLVAGSVDREDGARRFITVRATSDDGSHADTTFEIQVADVNEFAVTTPMDSDAGENLVGAAPAEGDYTGITVSASDGDATLNSITYALLAGGDDFAIDALTGVVTVGAGFDTSGPVTRAITVEALWADGSRAQASFDISVGSAFTILDGTSVRDTLDGTSGRDVLNGLGDNDTYYVDSLGDTVIEDALGGTTDTVISEISITELFAHVENLELAGTGDLDATGNALDNKITGNGGANVLAGGDGRDKLYDEGGNDTLIGGDEVDILDGGAGDDVLIGNAGRNILTGGAGADMFVLANMPADATTYDKIKDFEALDGDLVALEGAVFTALGLTVEAGEIVMGTEALEADDFLIFDAGSGKLYYDADGSGAGEAQQIALLDGVTTLSEADFLIL